MRQFGCVEIDLEDALILRDALRPLAKVDPYDGRAMIVLCEKLYEAILKLKSEDLKTINLALEEHEALFINQFVSNEDWQHALALLEQTWLVLYERRHERAYPRPSQDIDAAIDQVTRRNQQ